MSGKIYKIGFFVLLAINVAVVSVIVVKRPGRHHERGDIRERLSNQLGFDDSQKATFMERAQMHRDKIRMLEKKERELVKAYFNHIQNPDSTRSKESILSQIQDIKADKLQSTFDHFESIKEICTEEQQVNFEAFMNKVIPMISGAQRHRMKKPR